jgi:hypothetical protein
MAIEPDMMSGQADDQLLKTNGIAMSEKGESSSPDFILRYRGRFRGPADDGRARTFIADRGLAARIYFMFE